MKKIDYTVLCYICIANKFTLCLLNNKLNQINSTIYYDYVWVRMYLCTATSLLLLPTGGIPLVSRGFALLFL